MSRSLELATKFIFKYNLFAKSNWLNQFSSNSKISPPQTRRTDCAPCDRTVLDGAVDLPQLVDQCRLNQLHSNAGSHNVNNRALRLAIRESIREAINHFRLLSPLRPIIERLWNALSQWLVVYEKRSGLLTIAVDRQSLTAYRNDKKSTAVVELIHQRLATIKIESTEV